MKTVNEIVREVAASMLNTSMQDITAERIHGWATRLGDAATCKDSLQVGNKSLTPNEMETINDIVREMRAVGRLDKKSTDKIPRSLQGLGLRTYADRIEAAVRRIRSRCYAALDGEYDCAHGYEIREAFKGEVNDGV